VGTLEVIGIGVGAFVATNIDDLFILMVFFAKRDFPTSQIILGQYAGMGFLLGVSLFASLIALVIPQNLIALVGLFPIAIRVKELVEVRDAKDVDDDSDDNVKVVNRSSKSRWRTYLPFVVVNMYRCRSIPILCPCYCSSLQIMNSLSDYFLDLFRTIITYLVCQHILHHMHIAHPAMC
jgi:cadmium resistance protein CadD (predicted permease)